MDSVCGVRRWIVAAARVLATALAVSLAACGAGREPGEADSAAAAFLGADAVAILAAPERIESFRVARPLDRPIDTGRALAGVERLSDGPLLDAAQAALVRDLLFTEDSYLFELAKGCIPTPGVLLRAWRGGRHADLYLCFECQMWAVTVDTPADRFPLGREWEDFDPVQRPLVALVKALFPSDAALQALR